jgi:hypothetical protein
MPLVFLAVTVKAGKGGPLNAGVVALIDVALSTVTLVQLMPAMSTVVPAANPVPVMVMTVPPLAGPVFGVTEVTVGGEIDDGLVGTPPLLLPLPLSLLLPLHPAAAANDRAAINTRTGSLARIMTPPVAPALSRVSKDVNEPPTVGSLVQGPREQAAHARF